MDSWWSVVLRLRAYKTLNAYKQAVATNDSQLKKENDGNNAWLW